MRPQVPAHDPRPLLTAAAGWCADLIAGIPDGLWDAPTPCGSFSVRVLVGHMRGVLDVLARVGRDGEDREPSPFRDAPESEYLGFLDSSAREWLAGRPAGEAGADFRKVAAAAVAMWDDDRLAGVVTVPWGEVLPGHVALSIWVMEYVAHGWDLARATGQAEECDPALAAAALEIAVAGLPAEPRGVASGVPFGPVVGSAADAGDLERLANWLGRVTR